MKNIKYIWVKFAPYEDYNNDNIPNIYRLPGDTSEELLDLFREALFLNQIAYKWLYDDICDSNILSEIELSELKEYWGKDFEFIPIDDVKKYIKNVTSIFSKKVKYLKDELKKI